MLVNSPGHGARVVDSSAADGWVVYTVDVERIDGDQPIDPGTHRVLIVEGVTYRSLASGREYTIHDVHGGLPPRVRYTYEHAGETVEREDPAHTMGVLRPITPREQPELQVARDAEGTIAGVEVLDP